MRNQGKKTRPTLVRAVALTLIGASLLLGLSTIAVAEATFGPPDDVISESQRSADTSQSSWAMSLDNDLFAAGDNDQDYTGGFNLTISGGPGRRFASPTHRALRWLDQRIGFGRTARSDPLSLQQEAVQFGLLVFTPEDIETAQALRNDRPYANLVFLSNSRYTINRARTTMYQTTLSIGLVGTGIAEQFQKAIHKATDGNAPKGYGHQISDGGELTARYAIARHSLLLSGHGSGTSYDVKLALEGSVGYLTEATVGLGLRWGQIGSPWWTSTSEYADYTSQPSVSAAGRRFSATKDAYFSAGVKLRARAYNTFLQGQFRDSDVTFAASDLHRLLAEAWVGWTTEFGGLRISYILRHQTSEMKRGASARSLTWAGITVARSYR
jgi:hypothetical protein